MIIFDVNWKAETAGPSPDNNTRTELFLFGCKKAARGTPCPGCFNKALWDSSKATSFYTPSSVYNILKKYSPNKYITIGGGEPTDQLSELVELTKYLHKGGFNVMVYTWHSLIDVMGDEDKTISKEYLRELLMYTDIIVDGKFIKEESLYKFNCSDGLYGSVGSGNQIVWNTSNKENIYGYALKDINEIQMLNDSSLSYKLKENANIKILRKEILNGQKDQRI